MLHCNKMYLIPTLFYNQNAFKHFSKLFRNAHSVMQLVYTDVFYVLILQATLNQTVRTMLWVQSLVQVNYSTNYGTKSKLNNMGEA